jgi:hypothetical protein
VNLEVVGHLKVMKYCFKYVFKRPDSATICLDEIDHYISSRVLSAGEAAWRLLGLPLHAEFPSIMRLDVHLPRQHRVVFDAAAAHQDAAGAIAGQTTTLLQWFELNTQDASARWLKYAEIPGAFTWKANRWHKRKYASRCLGRMFMVGCETSELFFLRRLLGVVRGARSFADLLSFGGAVMPNFQAACAARGMLADDAEYISAMQDIISLETSVDAIRQSFVHLLVRCRPSNSVVIFHMFLPDICGVEDPQLPDIECTIWALEGFANDLGTSLSCSGWVLPALRMITRPAEDNLTVHLHNRDVAFANFSDEQVAVAAEVLAAVQSGVGGVFYLSAAGGCGKSFWANGVSAAVWVSGGVPVVVAASAMAASVLHGGRTAHATWHIPLECVEGSFCALNEETRSLIRSTDVVFWDECSMVHTDVAECVNRSFQDLMRSTALFGGKVVVFMGDFRQLLPVVRHSCGDNSTIMRSSWWHRIKHLRLSHNFRSDCADYRAMLNSVGVGDVETVAVPPQCWANSLSDLVDRVFAEDFHSPGRHIVTTTLEAAARVNNFIISLLPGEAERALAADSKIHCRDDLYSDEFLASLSFPGVPPAELLLKVGGRYMIMRNLDPHRQMLNGTIVTVRAISTYSLRVELPSGRVVCIPRISFFIKAAVSGLPFDILRRQFPLIPAYALTVHRIQGQTLIRMGIFVASDIFCHGMLYTCLSRVGGWECISVWSDAESGYAVLNNVVRPHVVAHLRNVPLPQ